MANLLVIIYPTIGAWNG